MSHFAEINSDSIVQRVIVAEQDFINSGKVGDSFVWVQCSYNNNYRKQFPGNGYRYDKTNDVFVAPQPYPSWTLDSNHDWQPPTARPSDGKMYTWNESKKAWDEI
tara:strand:- start:54 stop:368 length:315 start_codon:yes stop_codon:yes gene_type:complete